MLKNNKKKQKRTLCDIIEMIIRKHGGIAHLSLIYQKVEAIKPKVSKATIRAIIRDACEGTLRRSTDQPRFIRISKGVYGIYRHNKPLSKCSTVAQMRKRFLKHSQ